MHSNILDIQKTCSMDLQTELHNLILFFNIDRTKRRTRFFCQQAKKIYEFVNCPKGTFTLTALFAERKIVNRVS